MSDIVLSGIRATGHLHLGNYLGAMRNFVALQNEPDRQCFFFIADYHTLTTAPDPDELRTHLPEIAAGYIAAGLDPEKSTIYAQSSVPEIAELALLLSMIAPVKQLLRLPTYQEKMALHPNNTNMGLLNYPILMTADILGPQATTVPVGEDQLIHVELARNLARKFNATYRPVFAEPHAVLEKAARVPGLDGEGKMGKSADNTINLLDDERAIRQKISVGKTDTARKRREDPGTPYKCAIYGMHQFVTPETKLWELEQGCLTANIGCVECKNVLSGGVNNLLTPYRERYEEVAQHPDRIIEILHEGGRCARIIISETVQKVRDCMGLASWAGGPIHVVTN